MLLRTIARPMLASAFIARGTDALQRPGPHLDAAQTLADRVTEPLGFGADAELLVRVNGAVMAGAGALLAMGKVPRLASTALAVSMVPAAVLEHRFWRESEPDARRAEKKALLTNLALLGGVLLAAADTAGRPGLAWRAGHARRTAALRTQLTARGLAGGVAARLPF